MYNSQASIYKTTLQLDIYILVLQFVQPTQLSLYNHGVSNVGRNEEEEDNIIMGIKDELIQFLGPFFSPNSFLVDDGGQQSLLDNSRGKEIDIDEDEDILATYLKSYYILLQSWQQAIHVTKQATQCVVKCADLAIRCTIIRLRRKLW